MRVAIVANPVSGGGRARRHGAAVRAAIAQWAGECAFVETTGPGHAARLAGDFARDGFDLVVAFGGDGTASETADGLVWAGAEPGVRLPEFGIIPAGTGMDFRRNFSIPVDPVAAARALATATARPIDVGRATFHHADGSESVRHFLNVASIGLSGEIVTTVNAAKAEGRSRVGDLVYLVHSLKGIWRYRPHRVRIEADGVALPAEQVAVVAIANGGWFGGGMHLAPDAHPADGVFDLVVMQAASRLRLVTHLAKVYGGRHRNSPDIAFRRVTSVRIEGSDGIAAEMDGESTAGLPVTYRVLPGALMLRG